MILEEGWNQTSTKNGVNSRHPVYNCRIFENVNIVLGSPTDKTVNVTSCFSLRTIASNSKFMVQNKEI